MVPPAAEEHIGALSTEAVIKACLSLGKAPAMEVFPGISMNPDVRCGKPCLTGTRMDVATRGGIDRRRRNGRDRRE